MLASKQKFKIMLKSNIIGTVIPPPINHQIRPSDEELRKRLREKVIQLKHTSNPLNIRLKLITKPKFPPQIFDLKDIECNSTEPCKNDQCRRCYNRSFASAPSNLTENWSAENPLRPRDVALNSNQECWFDCTNKECGHRFLRSPKEVLRPPGDKKGSKNKNKDKKEVKLELKCPGPKCEHQALCDDDCQDCKISSFLPCDKANDWSDHKVDGLRLNGEWYPRNVYRAGTFMAWFDCKNCNHVFKMALNEVSKGKWCPYCCKGGQKKFCETHDCYWCHIHSFASHKMSPQ